MRPLIVLALTAGLLGTATCGGSAPCCIDLLNELPRAQVRPATLPADALVIAGATVGGSIRRSLSAPAPSRVIFRLRIPTRASLTTALAIENPGAATDSGIIFRLGISDGRTYEQLLDTTIRSNESVAWRPVTIDLSSYAGWQWSLFYHPSSIEWQVVLNTYADGPNGALLRGLWAAPAIQPHD